MPHPVNPADTSQRMDPSTSPEPQASAVDERFDVLARLARQHFAVTTALITLNDAQQQYLKSCAGLAFKQAPGERWLYELPLVDGGILVATQRDTDNRFSQQPLVIDNPHLRFYARCPLEASNGDLLGALWLLDDQPRELDEQQREFLRDLARLAAITAERDHLESRLRKEAEALRESERRMALAIAGSGTGIWDRNIQTGEIHYSEGWKSMFGYAAHEVSNRIEDSYQRVHPDDLASVQAAIQAHHEGTLPSYSVEHRLRCKDGSYKWVSSRGKVISRDSAGRPLRMIGTTSDITERKRIEAELQEFATTDFLTQLPNRRHFMGHIEAELTRIQRGNSQSAAVLMCDLDHFKSINDQWGHAVGDLALKHFAGILREQLRKSDLAGRVGGEEFAVVLGDASRDEALGFAQRVQQRLAQTPLLEGEHRIVLTVSIGIAAMSAADSSVDAPLSRSDQALYGAKEHGRNRIECL